MVLADLPLRRFLAEALIPYESDEVTRLIVDRHDEVAFAPLASLTVGEFREWLLGDAATGESLAAVAPGLTPEMVAAASKLMRNQDLIAVARKCRVVTAFRDKWKIERMAPGHCTGQFAFAEMIRVFGPRFSVADRHAKPAGDGQSGAWMAMTLNNSPI